MVMLKGNPCDIDNLLGYSKLQEVIEKIIAAVNGQDELMLALRAEIEPLTTRMNEQDAVVEQVKVDCEETFSKAQKCVEAQAGNNMRFGLVDGKLIALEEKLKKALDMDYILQQIKALGESMEPLFARMDAAEAGAKDLLDQLAAGSGVNDLIAGLEAKLKAIKDNQDQENASFHDRIAKAEEQISGAELTLVSHEDNLAAVDVAAKLHAENLEKAKADHAENFSKHHNRFDTLEGELQVGLEELRQSIANANNKEEMAKCVEDVKRLQDALRELRAKETPNLRPLIDALGDKEASDVQRIMKEVNGLTNKMSSFMDKGASATARCLSCFDRKAQLHNTIVVGSDGKTYLKTNDGASVGRLNVPNAGRSGSPSRSMVYGSSGGRSGRGGMGGIGALSAGTL